MSAVETEIINRTLDHVDTIIDTFEAAVKVRGYLEKTGDDTDAILMVCNHLEAKARERQAAIKEMLA